MIKHFGEENLALQKLRETFFFSVVIKVIFYWTILYILHFIFFIIYFLLILIHKNTRLWFYLRFYITSYTNVYKSHSISSKSDNLPWSLSKNPMKIFSAVFFVMRMNRDMLKKFAERLILTRVVLSYINKKRKTPFALSYRMERKGG